MSIGEMLWEALKIFCVGFTFGLALHALVKGRR